MTTDISTAVEQWRTQGWTVVHDLVPTEEIDAAVEELWGHFHIRMTTTQVIRPLKLSLRAKAQIFVINPPSKATHINSKTFRTKAQSFVCGNFWAMCYFHTTHIYSIDCKFIPTWWILQKKRWVMRTSAYTRHEFGKVHRSHQLRTTVPPRP